jgi:hypothetical protein
MLFLTDDNDFAGEERVRPSSETQRACRHQKEQLPPLTVSRFTSTTSHGQQSGCSQGRSTTVSHAVTPPSYSHARRAF